MNSIAHEQLLLALRALGRGESLEPLHSLLADALKWEQAHGPYLPNQSDIAVALVRVLGHRLAEETPVTVAEAAQHLEKLEARARALTATEKALRRAHRAPVAHQLVAIENARLFCHESTSLARALDAVMRALAADLSRRCAPLVIEVEEAFAVALWAAGRPHPLSAARAALLELASALDEFCVRAPLSAEALQALRSMARTVDEGSRDEPGFSDVASRVWLLRGRLLGPAGPKVALPYRLPPSDADGTVARPALIEAMLSDACSGGRR